MVLIQQMMTLPVKGTISDWENLSGDPDDPIFIIGPREFYREIYDIIPIPAIIPENEVGIRSTLLGIDSMTMLAETIIIAHSLIMTRFEIWLDTFLDDDAMCSNLGINKVIKPPGQNIKQQHSINLQEIRNKQNSRGIGRFLRRGQGGRV